MSGGRRAGKGRVSEGGRDIGERRKEGGVGEGCRRDKGAERGKKSE